jgi:hypothetical protein
VVLGDVLVRYTTANAVHRFYVFDVFGRISQCRDCTLLHVGDNTLEISATKKCRAKDWTLNALCCKRASLQVANDIRE